MKHFWKICISLVFVTMHLCAINQNLIIIMDEKGEQKDIIPKVLDPSINAKPLGIMMSRLLSALEAETSLILVSSQTFAIFLKASQLYNDITSNIKTQELSKKYGYSEQDLAKIMSEYDKYKIGTFFRAKDYVKQGAWSTLQIADYEYQKLKASWKLYVLNNNFVLLIPNTYIKQRIQDPQKISITDMLEMDLPQEIALDALALDTPKQSSSDAFMETIKALFRPSRLRKNQNNDVNHWYIVLSGHSGIKVQESVAGLLPSVFTQFLTFMNNRIVTDVFYYAGCFVGGRRLVSLYSRFNISFKLTRTKMFNYDIIVEAYAFVSTVGYSVMLYPYQPLSNISWLSQRWNPYFEKIAQWHRKQAPTKNKTDRLVELADILKYTTSEYGARWLDPLQIPVIRFAHQEWFNLVNPDNKVFYLTQTLIHKYTHEEKKLRIKPNKSILQLPSRTFSEQPGIIKIEQFECNFPIEFPASLSAIISIASYDAHYYFLELEAQALTFMDSMRAFLVSKKQLYERIFYIKTLKTKADQSADLLPDYKTTSGIQKIFSANEPLTLTNVWIFIRPLEETKRGIRIEFEYNNAHYQTIYEYREGAPEIGKLPPFERTENFQPKHHEFSTTKTYTPLIETLKI